MVLRVAILLSLLFAVTAEARKRYDFNDEDYLAPASAMSSWQALLDRYAEQRDDLLNCVSPRGCKGRLKSFNRILRKARGLSERDQLHLVNFYINRNDYDEDRIRRERDEEGRRRVMRTEWVTLYEFLSKDGDCEDYATSKYFMLRELGYEPSRLRVVVAHVRRPRGYHAVLAVEQTDGSVWLLDSDNTIRKTSHGEYRFVYAVNEESIWDHRDDYIGAEKVGAEKLSKRS